MMKTLKLLTLLVLTISVAAAQTRPVTKTKTLVAKATPTTPVTAAVAAPVGTGLPSDEFFEQFVLKHSDTPAPAGYGLSAEHPILVGAYEADLSNQQKVNHELNRFLKTYLWADGSQIVFIDRKREMINSVNIDKFRVTKAGSKDTLTLYTDMYNSGPVAVPAGFKFYSKQQFATELTPICDQIKKYDAIPDKYGDDNAKQVSFQLLGFMQSSVGIDYLMDKDVLAPLLNDVGLDLDLKAFLMRSYMFHKFVYEVTGVPDAKKNAFNFMVDDYQTAIKAHDVFSKGNLATTMVKK
jgi:hypothetical protein